MASAWPKPEALTVDGHTESLYVFFREGVRIADTVQPVIPGVGRVLIYVGADGIPVAFQVVDRLERPSGSELSVSFATKDDAIRLIFAMACQFVAFKEASRQELGEHLIRDALDVARFVNGPDGDCLVSQ